MERDLGSYKDYENKCRDAERANTNLGKEVERLNKIIRGNSEENEGFRMHIHKL